MRTKKMGLNKAVLFSLISSLLLISCGSTSSNETSSEKLSAYCIRECVLETGDSEICDARCDCTSKTLSEKLSKDEFSKLVIDITGGGSQDLEDTKSIKEFTVAIKRCKSANY
jgi:hypothetical protein